MPRLPAALPGWLLAELGPTLGLATVLAGSTRGAADLVTETLARDRSWLAVEDGPDPTPRLRAAVVRTFLGSPLGRSKPPGSATGLDALAGATRTAVVLRDLEQLNTGEIATVMDRPGKGIAQRLATVPTGHHDTEIAELRTTGSRRSTRCPAASPGRPVPSDGSRRRRTAALAALAVAVVAAVRPPHDRAVPSSGGGAPGRRMALQPRGEARDRVEAAVPVDRSRGGDDRPAGAVGRRRPGRLHGGWCGWPGCSLIFRAPGSRRPRCGVGRRRSSPARATR